MESVESLEVKRARDTPDDEETRAPRCHDSDEGEFEIPKEHQRLAKKRQKLSKPEAVIQKNHTKTTIAEVRNVLLWVLSDSHGIMPKWCLIRNKNLVQSVTVIITPFIDRHTLFDMAGSNAGVSAELPFFSHCIRGSMIPMSSVGTHRYPAVCPVLSTFLSTPLQGKNPQWVDKLSDTEDATPPETEQPHAPISAFLMSVENRRANDIPEALGDGRVPPGFVSTIGKKMRTVPPINPDQELTPMLRLPRDQALIESDVDYSNLFGIDCEMVDTLVGKELARVSLIDHLGRTLYDSIVLPENEITDYITQYSGITPKMIRECKTSFKEAQRQLLSFLDEKSILVGHAIQNDLQCLKFIHERVVDTSDIFPHPNGHPSKHSLVFLLNRVLRETLDREGGHDSVDDAAATLRVAMKKFARGWDYSPVGTGTSRTQPLGKLIEGRAVLFADIEDQAGYRIDGLDINPDTHSDAKLRIHLINDFQLACESATATAGTTQRKEALVATDLRIRTIVSELDDDHIVLVFSGCGDIHSFKKFEQLADKCEDETKRIEVEKTLQRAKDKAISAFAIISAVGDLPAVAKRTRASDE